MYCTATDGHTALPPGLQWLILPLHVQVKLEAARSKAEGIAAQEDRPLGSRMRDIEKVYAKARSTGKSKFSAKKPSKTSRSETINKQKKGRPLDKRMFADKRQVNLKQKKKAGKGRKGGAAGAAGKGGKGSAGKGGRGSAGKGQGKGRPAKGGR